MKPNVSKPVCGDEGIAGVSEEPPMTFGVLFVLFAIRFGATFPREWSCAGAETSGKPV